MWVGMGNFLAYENSHMWESYGKSSFPHVGILWEIVIPMGVNPGGDTYINCPPHFLSGLDSSTVALKYCFSKF